MSKRSWRAGGVALVAAVTIATCLQPVTGGAAAAAAPVPFGTYTGSKPLAEIPNGTVLKTRTLPYHLRSFEVPLKVVQLLYRTTDALGRPTVNVTSVIKTPFQAKTSRAVAYGSFYDSLNPSDSPSDGISGGSSPGTVIINVETALVVPLLLEGYSVVVADTQGATADFAAGPEYGRTTLDSIRAVLQAPRTGVRSNARFALAGYSGGAIATEWAAALAPSYAPEVNKRLVGAAEGGVLVDPDHNLHYIEGSKVWAGVLLMALVGASRAADISLEPYLNPYGLSVFKKVENASIANVLGRYPGLTWKKIAKPQYATPEDVPAFVRVVNTLNIGSAPTPTIPMLIGQGANGVLEGTEKSTTYGAGDGVMVAGDVRGLARQYCAHGVRIRYRQYDATSHFTSVPLWVPEAVTWVTQRFGKAPAPSSCATIKPGNALTPLPVPAG